MRVGLELFCLTTRSPITLARSSHYTTIQLASDSTAQQYTNDLYLYNSQIHLWLQFTEKSRQLHFAPHNNTQFFTIVDCVVLQYFTIVDCVV